MKHSLTISRRCSDQLPERSRCRTSCCACVKALPLPTSTRCSSVLWRHLAVGTKLLSSALIGRDWIPVSVLRWRYDHSVGLESFMQKANRISQRLSACHTTEAAHQPVSPATVSPVPEPMQVDTARLSSHERARR